MMEQIGVIVGYPELEERTPIAGDPEQWTSAVAGMKRNAVAYKSGKDIGRFMDHFEDNEFNTQYFMVELIEFVDWAQSANPKEVCSCDVM